MQVAKIPDLSISVMCPFPLFVALCPQSTNVTDGRTDGQTDRRHARIKRVVRMAFRAKNAIKAVTTP